MAGLYRIYKPMIALPTIWFIMWKGIICPLFAMAYQFVVIKLCFACTSRIYYMNHRKDVSMALWPNG